MDRGSRNLLKAVMAAAFCAAALPAVAQVSNEDVHAAERASFGFGTLRQGANGNDPDAPNASNTDEALVREYSLPPLFQTPQQQTPDGWPARRAELSQMMEDVWVGRIPATVERFTIRWEKVPLEEASAYFDEEEWTGHITTPDGRSGPVISATVTFPGMAQNAPAFMSYTYVWPPGFDASALAGDGDAPPSSKQMALERGWAHIEYRPQMLQADNGAQMQDGVIGLARWPRAQHDWGALRAWGWGASQLRAELGEDPRIAANHIILTGHSRFGKSVLVAAAYDHAFHDAHVSSSGAGGASLMRRNFGELWENMASSGAFHWYTPNAMNFARDPLTVHDLPVDAHTLIALRAPRPLFITTGLAEKGESWVDPVGNWTSFILAQPVWELHGASIPRFGMPVPQSREQLPYPLAWYQHGEGHVPWPAFDEFYEHAERFFDESE